MPQICPPTPAKRPACHRRYTGTAAALGCLAAFLAACYSDPGTVTAANAAAHAALYPYDGLVGGTGRLDNGGGGVQAVGKMGALGLDELPSSCAEQQGHA